MGHFVLNNSFELMFVTLRFTNTAQFKRYTGQTTRLNELFNCGPNGH